MIEFPAVLACGREHTSSSRDICALTHDVGGGRCAYLEVMVDEVRLFGLCCCAIDVDVMQTR